MSGYQQIRLNHRQVSDVHRQRSLSTLNTQHRQLVQSMMRMLDVDGIDLSKPPYTNHVRSLHSSLISAEAPIWEKYWC